MQRFRDLLEMIKFEHTVFALPFALLSLFLASDGLPALDVFFWVIVAMVGARSTAMMMNRIADRKIDAENPRTASRHLAQGTVSLTHAWIFALASATLFVLAASRLNSMTLALSPLALLVIWGYSWTKRFTWAAHLWLGLSLGLAPVGAWIAVRGQLDLLPVLLGIAVLFWVAGFDTIYACQDAEFDRRKGLHSIPVLLGTAKALLWSRIFHTLMLALFVSVGFLQDFSWLYACGLFLVAGLLVIQHALVNPRDLSHIDIAFFNVNSIVGVLLLAFTLADRLLLG